MITIKSDNLVFCDVDDTLIFWKTSKPNITIRGVKFKINENAINLLKTQAAIGHTIVIWSQGGWEWAKTVVDALDLNHITAAVMSKPKWLYDDMSPTYWLPEARLP